MNVITLLDPANIPFSLAASHSPRDSQVGGSDPGASIFGNKHMSETSKSSPRSLVADGGFKTPSIRNRSDMLPSPEIPNRQHIGRPASRYHKGWSSERVPLPNARRKFGNSAALLPLGNGAKTLPSKWEDAEKWICSPIDGVKKSALTPHHRRPKSKSGPLGPSRGFYSTGVSPSLPDFDGGRIPNFMVNSPFMSGILIADPGCANDDGREGGGVCGGNRSNSVRADHEMVRSSSVHGWSELLMEASSSLPRFQDENTDSSKNGTTTMSSVILRKDVATQMSPEGGTHSSKGCPPLSSPQNSCLTIGELHTHFASLEVKDVQVDERVTATRWSKKNIARGLERGSVNIIQWKKKTAEAPTSCWEVAKTAKSMSRLKRKEAKITAWENLQKAKAEAAIQKLEIKLEKMRSSSMDKILKRLRSTQIKAEEMRKKMNANQTRQASKTSVKTLAFGKKGHVSSLSNCFTCHSGF